MRRKRCKPMFRPVFAFSLLAVMCVSVSAQVVEKKKDSVRFIKPAPLERAEEAAPPSKPRPPVVAPVRNCEALPLTDADKLQLWRVAHKVDLRNSTAGANSFANFDLPHTKVSAWVRKVAHNNPRSPAASGDIVVVGSGGGNQVYGLDISTGRQLWMATSKDAGISSIEIDGDSAYYTTYSCTFERVRLISGEIAFVKWISPTVDNQPAVRGGKAFCSYQGANGTRLTAHSIETGAEKWSINAGANGGIQGPVIGDGCVLLATTDGALGCYDLDSGKLNWKQSLGLTVAPVAVPGGILCVTPVAAPKTAEPPADSKEPKPAEKSQPAKPESDRDSVVPVKPAETSEPGSDSKSEEKVLAAHGTQKLGLFSTGAPPAQNPGMTGPPGNGGLDYQGARPGYDGEMAFFAHNGRISALGLAPGSKHWEVAVAGSQARHFTTPVVSAQMMIVATSDGYVLAFSRATGQTIWAYQFEGQSFASKPAVGKDRVMFTSTSGALISIPTGVSAKSDSGKPVSDAEISRDFEKNRKPNQPPPSDPNAGRSEEAARPPEATIEPEAPPTVAGPSKGEQERAEKRKQERKEAKGEKYEPKPFRRE